MFAHPGGIQRWIQENLMHDPITDLNEAKCNIFKYSEQYVILCNQSPADKASSVPFHHDISLLIVKVRKIVSIIAYVVYQRTYFIGVSL